MALCGSNTQENPVDRGNRGILVKNSKGKLLVVLRKTKRIGKLTFHRNNCLAGIVQEAVEDNCIIKNTRPRSENDGRRCIHILPAVRAGIIFHVCDQRTDLLGLTLSGRQRSSLTAHFFGDGFI